MQYQAQSIIEEGQPRPKYVVQKTKNQKEFFEKNRSYTYKKFCKKKTTKMADPVPSKKLSMEVRRNKLVK